MPDLTPEDPAFFAGLVAQVSDCAIMSLDPQGLITSWNVGAELVKQYTAEEAVGRSFATFYTDHDRRAGLPMELLDEARRAGHVAHTGWRRRKDGTLFWGDVVITALHDAEGRDVGFAQVTRDLTEQHQLEVQLRESEERLRLLVGQVVDYAIIALVPQGTIETWNLGAERLKGYTAEQALGLSFASFYTPEDRRAGLPARLLETARRDGRVEHAGWRVRRDGSRFWGDVVITALHDDDTGALTGYAKVTRDRTDLKRLEEAQDAFYAAFRHDFRAPLTSLQGFVQLLRDAEEQDRGRLVDRIEASSDRLLSMVEGLVDFATTRAAVADLPLGTIDVVQVVRAVVSGLGPELRPRRVVVSGEVALAVANGDALHRVLTNLLVNALKYSDPEAPVHVGVTLAEPDDGGPAGVEVRVRDRGRGIDPRDLETIFEELERGRLAEADGGTGLGLASVRRLVEQQRGRVALSSELGRGTTATVWLPRDAVVPGPAQDPVAADVPVDPSADPAGQPSG